MAVNEEDSLAGDDQDDKFVKGLLDYWLSERAWAIASEELKRRGVSGEVYHKVMLQRHLDWYLRSLPNDFWCVHSKGNAIPIEMNSHVDAFLRWLAQTAVEGAIRGKIYSSMKPFDLQTLSAKGLLTGEEVAILQMLMMEASREKIKRELGKSLYYETELSINQAKKSFSYAIQFVLKAHSRGSLEQEQASFELYIDPGDASADDIRRLLNALSELHCAYGGLGLNFQIDEMFMLAGSEVNT